MLIAAGVVASVCLVQLAGFDFPNRLERMSYDWRARQALRHPPATVTNLGFVSIGDESIAALNNSSLGFRYGLDRPVMFTAEYCGNSRPKARKQWRSMCSLLDAGSIIPRCQCPQPNGPTCRIFIPDCIRV